MSKSMSKTAESRDVVVEATASTALAYEAPVLMVVGEASEVVMGYPGNWFDYPEGITEPAFEFEQDGD